MRFQLLPGEITILTSIDDALEVMRRSDKPDEELRDAVLQLCSRFQPEDIACLLIKIRLDCFPDSKS
jgi:hypothetical protein